MRRAALLLLALLPVAIISLLFLSPNFLGTAVNTLLAGGSGSASGSSLDQNHQISLLELELQRLQEQLRQIQADKSAASRGGKDGAAAEAPAAVALRRNDPSETSVVIELFKFLGLQSFFAGVSWDPYACFPPPKTVWPLMSDETVKELEEKIVKALVQMVATLKKVDPKAIDPREPYYRMLGHDVDEVYTQDPDFTLWRAGIMTTLQPYLATVGGLTMYVTCNSSLGLKVYPQDLGSPAVDCSQQLDKTAIINAIGYYAMPYESIRSIARGFVTEGICTSQVRDHAPSYAHWLRQHRIFHDDWRTFSVFTKEQDAVLLLFDLLYEKLTIFTRQYWLGVINMQNPFDMYSIQDIIFVTRPTLLIETGTANGGSALLWASIMELSDMNSRIMTIDVNKPKWESGGTSWGGTAREDPTQHRLWKEHVTFLQGSTTDSAIFSQVQAAAQGQQVMVLLDSHHSEDHVSSEMALYCPLVSVGCYCIVEDTKMSRWSSNGPLESVKKFMEGEWGKKFIMDRERELLYTHHTMGYLKRMS